jgi:starch phosphorylase
MARLTPRFSADRAVRQYTEQRYLAAAAGYRSREKDKGEVGKSMVDWERRLKHQWNAIRFGAVSVEARGEQHLFEVQVFTQDLDPACLRVELFADGVNGAAPALQEMTRAGQLPGKIRGYTYTAQVSSARPREDYTARVSPYFAGVAVPLESDRVLWQK